jgi:hypothetical protein
LRWSASAINSGNFASATPIATGCPLPAGSSEHIAFGGTPCTTYYFALRTKDETTWSAVSNSPSAYVSCPIDGLQSGTQDYQAPHRPEFAIESSTASGVSFAIEMAGPAVGLTSLSVVDVLGRKVFQYKLSSADAGTHHVNWNLRRQDGSRVGVGVYFARLQRAGESRALKFTVVRVGRECVSRFQRTGGRVGA